MSKLYKKPDVEGLEVKLIKPDFLDIVDPDPEPDPDPIYNSEISETID